MQIEIFATVGAAGIGLTVTLKNAVSEIHGEIA